MTNTLIGGLAAGYITYVVVYSVLFSPLREWVFDRRVSSRGKVYKWFIFDKLEDLINCPFCFGFWASVIVGVYWKKDVVTVLSFVPIAASVAYLLGGLQNAKD